MAIKKKKVKARYRLNNQKNAKNKHLSRIAIFSAIIILLAGAIIWYSNNSGNKSLNGNTSSNKVKIKKNTDKNPKMQEDFKNDTAILFTVNGIPIAVKQFKSSVDAQQKNVEGSFSQKYMTVNSEIWNNTYNGENPNDTAKKLAFDGTVARIIKLTLLKEKGLIKSTDYNVLQKQMNEDKKKSDNASNANSGVYPQYSDLDSYLDYLCASNESILISKLIGKEWKATDDDLKKYYEQVKDPEFKNEDNVVVRLIVLPLPHPAYTTASPHTKSSGSGSPAPVTVDPAVAKVQNQMNEIKSRIDNGESFEIVAKKYNSDRAVREMALSESTLPKNNADLRLAFIEAQQLAPGKVSNILTTQDSLMLVKLIKRTATGFKPYKEVKNSMLSNYYSRNFPEYIAGLAKSAIIKMLSQEKYNEIRVSPVSEKTQ